MAQSDAYPVGDQEIARKIQVRTSKVKVILKGQR